MTILAPERAPPLVLLCPGPVMLSPGVRAGLARCEIGHRDAAFSALLARLRRNCLRLLDAGEDHLLAFLGGPATAALEAVLCSLVPAGAVVLVPVNGAFGRRLVEILEVHRIRHVALDFGFGRPLDLVRLEAEAAALREAGPVLLAMTHHETSAGLLNPVSAVGALARRLGLRLMVDATSSAGVEALSVSEDGIDACVTASGKCLHGPPGVGLACVRRDFAALTASLPPRSFALDLHRHLRQLEADLQTPFTPPVPLVGALDRAVEELLEGGVAARRREYHRRRELLARGFARLGLPLLPLPKGSAAASILTVGVPSAITFEALYGALKEAGYLVYGSKAPLAPHYFQVAVMGALPEGALEGFLAALERILTAAGAVRAATPGRRGTGTRSRTGATRRPPGPARTGPPGQPPR